MGVESNKGEGGGRLQRVEGEEREEKVSGDGVTSYPPIQISYTPNNPKGSFLGFVTVIGVIGFFLFYFFILFLHTYFN